MRNAEAVSETFSVQGCEVFIANFDRVQHGVRSVDAASTLAEKQAAAAAAAAPMINIAGRWALVTGASRGLGRQIACGLARLGTHLVLHARSPDHLAETTALCSAFGGNTHALTADLGRPEEIENFLDQLDSLGVPIDILYNNAGISPSNYGDFWKTPADAFAIAMAVNTFAPIRLCQHVLPTMIERRFGRVVNVSSSIQRRPAEIAYACSKAALDKFVVDIRDTLTGTGAMISLLDPGWLRTDMGGPNAPFAVDSALPGALLAAVVDGDINGHWIAAQDFAGMSLENAVRKAVVNGLCVSSIDPDITCQK
jgi:short-subunit dehydrogenase